MSAQASFIAEIRTPDRCHFNGPVDVVRMATETGPLEIHSGHAPLIGTVPYSRVKVRKGEHEEEFLVRNGLVFMDPVTNDCRILVQYCAKQDEIEYVTAKEYLDVVLAHLGQPESLSAFHIAYLEDERMALTKAIEDQPV